MAKKINHPIKIIGTRYGEKVHETLLSREEKATAQEFGNYYRIIPDSRDLNYDKYFKSGKLKITKSSDYNSSNAKRLNAQQRKKMLMQLVDAKDLLLKN